MFFCKLPSGATWICDKDTNFISGVVHVENFIHIEGFESQLDAISEKVMCDDGNLTNFSYQSLGGSLVSFSGFPDCNDEETECFQANSIEEFAQKADLASFLTRYGITEGDLAHAFGAQDAVYENECIIQVHGSNRQVHSPAYPEPASYVRVTIDGLEIACWVDDELREDPSLVIGAVMGAASGATFSR